MRYEGVCDAFTDHRTPDEPWTIERGEPQWYGAGCDYALEALGDGPGKALVVGSPIFEVYELQRAKWDVTFLDCRQPPVNGFRYLLADACDTGLEDGTFDAVSSTCVLCHVGMGRYGDNVVRNGDEKMLAEIARVLKPGGAACLMFGPVMNAIAPLSVGALHRVYTVQEVLRLGDQAGLQVEQVRVWDGRNLAWRSQPLPQNEYRDGQLYMDKPDYIAALLKK